MDYIRFEPSKFEKYPLKSKDKYYLFKNNYILIKKSSYTPLNREDIKKLNLEIETLFCLGAYKEQNCYVGEIIEEIDNSEYELIPLRDFVDEVEDRNEFLVSSRAFMLKNYRLNNKRCGRCGAKTKTLDDREDRAIVCTDCNHTIWPTNSPAVIVAVIKEDKILLAENINAEPGRYSVIAGFLEMGETFEDCVKREVYEETNIKVKNIKYFSSQPWAFPNSMMTAFIAEYDSGNIKIDKSELVHANWFNKEEAKKLYKNSRSIGSQLINWFIYEYEYKKE